MFRSIFQSICQHRRLATGVVAVSSIGLGGEVLARPSSPTPPGLKVERQISEVIVDSYTSGTITIEPRAIRSTDDFKPSVQGGTLRLQSRNALSSYYEGGGNIYVSGSGVSVRGSGVSVSSNGDLRVGGGLSDLVSSVLGGGPITINAGQRTVIINGTEVTPKDLKEIRARRRQKAKKLRKGKRKDEDDDDEEDEDDDDDDEEEKKKNDGFVRELSLPEGVALGRLTSEGTSSVKLDAAALGGRSLELTVKGMGGITVLRSSSGPQVVDRAEATVEGTGNIKMGGLKVGKLVATVKGMGDITDFFATESVDASVEGVGNISGSASASASVDRSTKGMGKIDIHRYR